jgi:hypothetical protein
LGPAEGSKAEFVEQPVINRELTATINAPGKADAVRLGNAWKKGNFNLIEPS